MTDVLEPADLAPARTRNAAQSQGDHGLPVDRSSVADAAPLVAGKPITALKLGMLSLLAKAGRPALKSAAIAELARRAEAASKAEISPSSDILSAAQNELTNEQNRGSSDTGNEAAATLPTIQAKSRRGKQADRAVAWLRKSLADGPVLAGDLKRQGVAAGFTKRTLERAAARLGIRRERPKFGGSYRWSLSMLANSGLARQTAPLDGEQAGQTRHAAVVEPVAEREAAL